VYLHRGGRRATIRTVDELNLDIIAARLEGLEETVINRLIDRAQFAHNPAAYQPGRSEFPNEPNRSLFQLRMRYQEEMDSRFGRFMVPEERPLNRDLPPAMRTIAAPLGVPAITDFDVVNLTGEICDAYLAYVPRLCVPGDDGQYGSSVEHDVLAIQAVARRVHFGALYVAESKFQQNEDRFRQPARAGDRAGILAQIERPEVEARILERVATKVDYVQAQVNRLVRRVVDPEIVLELYRDTVIPLTKEGQLRYLAARLPPSLRQTSG
jgi:chorismate mutase